MRNVFIYAVFGVLLIIVIAFLFQWYKTGERVQEQLAWPNSSTKRIAVIQHKQHKPTPPLPTSTAQNGTTEKSNTTTNKPVYYYSYSTAPSVKATKNKTISHNDTTKSQTTTALSNILKTISSASAPATNKPVYYSYSTAQPEKTTKNKMSSDDHTTAIYPEKSTAAVSDTVKTTPPTPEAILKYVLFTVNYDPDITAGDTQSLQLTMSPRSALTQLENVLKNKKIQQSQINDIEKIQNQYKYVSATLLAKNHCLNIEKKMPEEDKVYLQSINESAADQIWQWDLTAPETPATNVCTLSLFIRFCLNQNDCIPTMNPDKQFAIFIHITFVQKVFKWFTEAGNFANYGTEIAGAIPVLIGFFIWIRIWLKKRSASKTHVRR